MRPIKTSLLTLALMLSLSACRTAAPKLTTTPPSPASETTTDTGTQQELPHEIRWARDSAEHRANLIQIYRFAGEVLEAKAADLEPGTWAVALDADETVIDNSLYQKERALVGKDYDRDSWGKWVARHEAPPLPGALVFLSRVQELGGKIAIVTNRRHAHCPDTEANFRSFSIPFDVILCKKEEDRKESRWRQVEEGTAASDLPPLEIVMWLGDNIRDFPDLDQHLRDAPEEAFERFGIDFFAFPNSMYGSWDE